MVRKTKRWKVEKRSEDEVLVLKGGGLVDGNDVMKAMSWSKRFVSLGLAMHGLISSCYGCTVGALTPRAHACSLLLWHVVSLKCVS